nr:hypothetical protein [Clostridia bacterium]
MKKIAVIGICGKSVFLGCDKFPARGESIVCNSLHTEPGGKGVNTAITVKRLGGDVSYLVSLGNDEYGKECISFFEREKLRVKYNVKNGATDYGVVLHNGDGNNCVSVFIDDKIKLTENDVAEFETELKEASYVAVSAEVSDGVLLKTAEICEKYGTKIIFDPSPVREIPDEFLKKVWLFTPNETEFENLFKKITPENAVITLGGKGAILIEKGKRTEFPTVSVNVKNTTGAGDVFNGALCYSLSIGNDLSESVKFAMRVAAYKVSCQYVIEGIPTLKELKYD